MKQIFYTLLFMLITVVSMNVRAQDSQALNKQFGGVWRMNVPLEVKSGEAYTIKVNSVMNVGLEIKSAVEGQDQHWHVSGKIDKIQINGKLYMFGEEACQINNNSNITNQTIFRGIIYYKKENKKFWIKANNIPMTYRVTLCDSFDGNINTVSELNGFFDSTRRFKGSADTSFTIDYFGEFLGTSSTITADRQN